MNIKPKQLIVSIVCLYLISGTLFVITLIRLTDKKANKMKDLRTTYSELKAKAIELMESGNLSAYLNTLKEVNTVKRKLVLVQLRA